MLQNHDGTPGSTPVWNPPPHLEARFSRKRRRNGTGTHSPCSQLLTNSSLATTRRQLLLDSRKSLLRQRAAHVEKVRRARANSHEAVGERLLALRQSLSQAQESRNAILAKIAGSCAHEVAKAKRLAQETRARREEEAKALKSGVEERMLEAERRRSEMLRERRGKKRERGSSSSRMKVDGRSDIKEEDVSTVLESVPSGEVKSEKELKEKAARRIQKVYRNYINRKIVKRFLNLGLTIENVRDTSFENVSNLFKEEKAQKATARLLKLCGLLAAPATAKKVDVEVACRTFLSAYLILGHPTEVLSKVGENEKALITKSKDLLIAFESFLSSPSFPLTKHLPKSWESFSTAFTSWKAHDSEILINTMAAQYAELDLIWQKVKGDSEEHVAADFKEGIRENQLMLLVRIRRLAGEKTRELIRQAVKRARLPKKEGEKEEGYTRLRETLSSSELPKKEKEEEEGYTRLRETLSSSKLPKKEKEKEKGYIKLRETLSSSELPKKEKEKEKEKGYTRLRETLSSSKLPKKEKEKEKEKGYTKLRETPSSSRSNSVSAAVGSVVCTPPSPSIGEPVTPLGVPAPEQRQQTTHAFSQLEGGGTLSNRQIVHELALDRTFKLTPRKKGGLEQMVEREARRAFWDTMKEDVLERGELAKWIPGMAESVKGKLLRLLNPNGSLHRMISDSIDTTIIEQQCRAGSYDYEKFFSFVLGFLPKICSPARDADVQALISDTGDYIQRLQRLFDVLELFQLDHANFLLTMSAQYIIPEAIPYERRLFAADLEAARMTLTRTTSWLLSAKTTKLADAASRDPEGVNHPANRPSATEIYNHAFATLMMTLDPTPVTAAAAPETFHLDVDRINGFRQEFKHIVLGTAICITIKNLLRRNVRSAWEPLKDRVTTILSTLPPSPSAADIETLAESICMFLTETIACPKPILSHVVSAVTRITSRATRSVADQDPVVRVVAKRVVGFVTARLNAESSKERVILATGGGDKLTSFGMAEWIDDVGGYVERILMCGGWNRECYSPWYDGVLGA